MNIPKAIKKSLDNYPSQIVTRFPPEPSGYLHIGHAKAIFINYTIAKQYGGKFILRFDDTNPETETAEFVNTMQTDILSLDVKPDYITSTSDYFDTIISYADYLVLNNLAYVDDSDPETIKSNRLSRTDSIYRSANSIDKWNSMKNGEITNSVLRIKLNMKSDNGAMRDPTIFRHSIVAHFATGNKYCVYPTYDFACPIVDSIEGITHVYRSCEFTDRNEQYRAILSLLKLDIPVLLTYGKLNFTDAVMSKRLINKMIKSGSVDDWSDPRLLTIRGAKRRGLCLTALKTFINEIGFSKNVVNMDQFAIWKINKKIVDKLGTRYMVLPADTVRKYTITDTENVPDYVQINRFDRNIDLGKRNLYYSPTIYMDTNELATVKPGEEVTLMNFGNVIFDDNNDINNNIDVNNSTNNDIIIDTNNRIKTNLAGNFKTTVHKIRWLCERPDCQLVQIRITSYPAGNKIVSNYLGEPDMANIKVGDYVQLIKMHYYICDNVSSSVDRSGCIIDLIEMP